MVNSPDRDRQFMKQLHLKESADICRGSNISRLSRSIHDTKAAVLSKEGGPPK